MNEEEIRVKTGVDNTALGQGLRAAKAQVADFGREVGNGFMDSLKGLAQGVAGAFAVDKIWEGLKGGIEFGHQIKVASEEAGLGAEQFQRFTAAAEGLGVKADATGNALAMLARRVGDAREKGGEAAEAFDHFGISLAPGRSQIEILDQVMERMRGVTDATERAAIAEAAFGREGRDMVLLAAEGADAFKAAMQSADVLTDAEVAKLEAADAKLTQFKRKWDKWWSEQAGNLVIRDLPAGISEQDVAARAKAILDARREAAKQTGVPAVPRLKQEDRDQAIQELVDEKKKRDEAAAAQAESIKAVGATQAEAVKATAKRDKDAADWNAKYASAQQKAAEVGMTDQEKINALKQRQIDIDKELHDHAGMATADWRALQMELVTNEGEISKLQALLDKAKNTKVHAMPADQNANWGEVFPSIEQLARLPGLAGNAARNYQGGQNEQLWGRAYGNGGAVQEGIGRMQESEYWLEMNNVRPPDYTKQLVDMMRAGMNTGVPVIVQLSPGGSGQPKSQ